MIKYFTFKTLATFFLLLLAGLTHAQQFKLSKRSMTLEEVFQEIKEQTGRDILLSSKNLTVKARIDVDISRPLDLQSFLDGYFNTNSGFNLFLSDKTIFVQEHNNRVEVLRGKVISKNTRLPISNVNIRTDESGIRTTTNETGEFTLPSSEGVTSLRFSFIGFKEVLHDNPQKFFHIIEMEEDGTGIGEVVITGIYQRTKESFSGSSSTFSGKELKSIGNQSILQSLKTLDPSFQIKEDNLYGSDPNRTPDIEINGKSSVIGLREEYGANPNQPLFILDGFETPVGIIVDLNIDRVASVTILKDATASAIYGSKAANGVVVIETVKPLPGQLKLRYSVNGSYNFADLTDYNLMNAREKLEFEYQAGVFDNIGVGDNESRAELMYYDILKEIERGVDTYWLSVPLRKALVQRHTVSAEGGDENLRYTLSLAYGEQPGVMIGSDRQTTNGHVNLHYRKNKVSFSNSLSLDYVVADREPVSFDKFASANPYQRIFDTEGNIIKQWEGGLRVTSYNPYFDFNNHNVDKTKSNSVANNFVLLWDVNPNIVFRYRLGLRKETARSERFRSPYNTEFRNTDLQNQGSFIESNSDGLTYDTDATLTYVKILNTVHMINFVGGMRVDQTSSLRSSYHAAGFVNDEYANPAFAFGYVEGGSPQYTDSKRRSASFYLNSGYVFDQRFLVDATLRSDGSSVYGSSRQFTTIWSTGLGWNLHREKWLEDAHWLNNFKIRGSIGNPGNQNFNDYMAAMIYSFNLENRNPFGSSVVLSAIGNTNLRWQKTLNKNIGLDLEVLDRRVNVVLDYLRKDTDPLLVHIGVPSSLGMTIMTENLGAQQTKGFTLRSSFVLVRKNDFSWRANFSASQLRTTYSRIGNALNNYNRENQSRNLTRYYDGASPTDLWGVRSLGIDPASGREVYLKKNGEQTFFHSYDDEVVLGNSEPKVSGVVGMSFFYKGFSANLNMSYRYGGQAYMQTLFEKVENTNTTSIARNQDRRALYDRWKKPGDISSFNLLAIGNIYSTPTSYITSRFVQDHNQLLGDSFNIGYDAQNQAWLNAVGLSALSLKAYMNDIFYISTIKNERGINYPFARSVSFSVSVVF